MISRSQLTRKKAMKAGTGLTSKKFDQGCRKALSGLTASADKKPKMYSCKVCKAKYVKLSMSHVACSPTCAIAWSKRQREKREREAMRADRVADRAKKEAMKPRPQLIKEAQTAFNRYIRARDAFQPCICCGRPLTSSQGLNSHNVDAGHYRSVGSAPHLRFDERNCHAQLVQCNRYGAGRAVDYRLGLIERIGLEAVEALESDQESRNWTHDDLRSIRRIYELKLKDLLAARAEGQAC